MQVSLCLVGAFNVAASISLHSCPEVSKGTWRLLLMEFFFYGKKFIFDHRYFWLCFSCSSDFLHWEVLLRRGFACYQLLRVRIARYSAAYTSHESVLCTQLMSMTPVFSHNASLVESVVGQQDGL